MNVEAHSSDEEATGLVSFLLTAKGKELEEWAQKQHATKQHAEVTPPWSIKVIKNAICKKPVIKVIDLTCIGKIPEINQVLLKSAPKWGSMARSSTCTDAGLGAENNLSIFNEINEQLCSPLIKYNYTNYQECSMCYNHVEAFHSIVESKIQQCSVS